jgi:RimJ/RimL family protein N-acetyltransferase
MIAESAYRGRGCGLDAVCLMLRYAVDNLHLRMFEAKIGLDNAASLHMFSDKLGFVHISDSVVFNERTLRLDVDDRVLAALDALTPVYTVQELVTHSQ